MPDDAPEIQISAVNLTMPSVNAVYYPSWHVYKGRTPASIPISTVTHIYYAFIRYPLSPSLSPNL